MQYSSEKGSLLIEILVAVAIFGVMAALSAQAIVTSLASNAAAGAQGQQSQLLSEMLQGVRSASDESWGNIYAIPTDGTHNHVSLTGGKWVISSGDDTIVIAPRTFTRYFTMSAVSRDPVTRAIESPYNAAHDDPSTRLVQAYVTSSSTMTFSVQEYIFRWRNQVCNQSSWSSSGVSGTTTCSSGQYNSSSNITPGTSLQLCSGGC